MKKLLLITIVALSFNAKAQWVNQTSSTTNGLNGVYFVDADTGYAVADHFLNPTIIKTIDGGANWTTLYNSAYTASGVFFLTPSVGYVACNFGTILKTTNSGASWTGLAIGSMAYRSVFMTGTNNGCAVGGDGAGNGSILRTTDGTNFTASVTAPFLTDLNCVHFPTANRGYIAGNSGTILKSINGGATWTTSPAGVTTPFFGIYFTDSITGYAVGAGIYKTVNGGTSWTPQVSPTSVALYSVFFINSTTGYICGHGGVVLKTINGGGTWTTEISNTTLDLHCIHFPTACIGYSVGTGSVIIKHTCSTTSINENNTNSFELYPNPTTSQTTINFAVEQTNTTIRITDVLGKEIKTINFTGRQLTIEKGELKAGIYFIQTTDENKNVTKKKIIIQ